MTGLFGRPHRQADRRPRHLPRLFIEGLAIQGGDRYPSQLLGSGHQTLMRCYALPPMIDPN